MGQNFLISQKFRQKIMEAAELSPEDTVLEVGAGDGTLTFEIAKRAKLVFAVEKDKRLVLLLQKLVSEKKIKNIIVINEDILKLSPDTLNYEGRLLPEPVEGKTLFLKNYKLLGNIPYYLTSRLLRKFLAEEKFKPKEIILTVQKEVAERIIARPPHMNLLALSIQTYGKSKIIEKIPAEAFWPKPKVDSAIIKISGISNDFFTKNGVEQKKFFSIIKTCFQQKRKMLVNSLVRHCEQLKGAKQSHGHKTLEIASSLRPVQLAFAPRNDVLGQSKTSKQKIAEIIKKAGLHKNVRPEELSLEDWIKVYNSC